MDNAQKAIVVGVALFITIIIVAAVMLITGIGTNLLNKGTDKASNIAAQLDQTELEQYDNTTMSGALVLSAVKKYYTDSNICVGLIKPKTTGSGIDTIYTTPRCFGDYPANNIEYDSGNNCYKVNAGKDFTSATHRPTLGSFTSIGAFWYISPSSQWHAYLIKVNDGAVGICFVNPN